MTFHSRSGNWAMNLQVGICNEIHRWSKNVEKTSLQKKIVLTWRIRGASGDTFGRSRLPKHKNFGHDSHGRCHNFISTVSDRDHVWLAVMKWLESALPWPVVRTARQLRLWCSKPFWWDENIQWHLTWGKHLSRPKPQWMEWLTEPEVRTRRIHLSFFGLWHSLFLYV